MYENWPKYDRMIASVFTKRFWYVDGVTQYGPKLKVLSTHTESPVQNCSSPTAADL